MKRPGTQGILVRVGGDVIVFAVLRNIHYFKELIATALADRHHARIKLRPVAIIRKKKIYG